MLELKMSPPTFGLLLKVLLVCAGENLAGLAAARFSYVNKKSHCTECLRQLMHSGLSSSHYILRCQLQGFQHYGITRREVA
jgi:hypothetical protein